MLSFCLLSIVSEIIIFSLIFELEPDILSSNVSLEVEIVSNIFPEVLDISSFSPFEVG